MGVDTEISLLAGIEPKLQPVEIYTVAILKSNMADTGCWT